jgi:hypothetical protein
MAICQRIIRRLILLRCRKQACRPAGHYSRSDTFHEYPSSQRK